MPRVVSPSSRVTMYNTRVGIVWTTVESVSVFVSFSSYSFLPRQIHFDDFFPRPVFSLSHKSRENFRNSTGVPKSTTTFIRVPSKYRSTTKTLQPFCFHYVRSVKTIEIKLLLSGQIPPDYISYRWSTFVRLLNN